jgi:hypothetical protein
VEINKVNQKTAGEKREQNAESRRKGKQKIQDSEQLSVLLSFFQLN